MYLNTQDDTELARQLDSIIPNIRDRRRTVVEEWLQIHEAFKGIKTRSFFQSEIFNHKIPYFRRSVERFTVRLAQMVLPNSEFFEVTPSDEFDDEAGKNSDSVMHYELYLLKKKIRTYAVVKQLARTWALYGRSILKTGVKVVKEDGKDRVWPTARAIDPFMFIMWPETVSDVADAQIVVEDAFVTYEQYEDDVKEGRAAAINKEDLDEPTWSDLITRRLQTSGITDPTETTVNATNAANPVVKTKWVFRSEVWYRVDKGWRWCWIVWNLKGSSKICRRSTVTFPRPLYRISIARELPGEQYTSGMGNDQEPLSVLLNDQINMLLEGQATQFAPPAAVDPNLVTRANSLVYRPRAKWLIPPDGVKWMEPRDTTRQAYQGVQFTMGLMDTFSGSGGPMGDGQTMRNMPRAGFAVSSLMSMALADLRDVARSFEEDLLSPMLGDLFALTIRFVPESQIMKIPRTANFPGKIITRHDLDGDYSFNWIGSLQAQDNQDRANRLMTLFGALSKSGQIIMPDLQARGKRINWTVLLKRMWRDGVGERGADSIIEDIPAGEEQPLPGAEGAQQTAPQGPDISQLVRDFGAASIG